MGRLGEYGVTTYYKDGLKDAEEYQDFIADMLRKSDPCIIIQLNSSKKWQYERGESSCGIEIKHDWRVNGERDGKATDRLFIETHEKPDPDYKEWIPSGILRDDNSWLYLIGDYTEAWLFCKHQLRAIYECPDLFVKRGIICPVYGYPKGSDKPTSHGFLYPVGQAIKNGTCLRHFTFK